VTISLRQSPPAHILNSEEMKCFKKQAVIAIVAPTSWQASPKNLDRTLPILLAHPCRHRLQPPNQLESHESHKIHRLNPLNATCCKFVHTA
jgi:hypothetical protein